MVGRWRRLLVWLGAVGLAAGLAVGLLSRPRFVSSAMFIPESSDKGFSGLDLAASQLGIRLPMTASGWGPPIYVELLLSRMLLEPIALDTMSVAEESGRRVPMMDLLGIRDSELSPGQRSEAAVVALRSKVSVVEEKKLGGVRLTVATRWPSVSFAVASKLVSGVSDFNLLKRKSQATAERQFAESAADRSEHALREAEDKMQLFLQRNRTVGSSPELTFARDRLLREVSLRQAIYASLMQQREEARLKEVRDIPVITTIESPRFAVRRESRRLAVKAVLGALAGVMSAVWIAFVWEILAAGRSTPVNQASGLSRLLYEALPRAFRRQAP